jgi:hypothetical protein
MFLRQKRLNGKDNVGDSEQKPKTPRFLPTRHHAMKFYDSILLWIFFFSFSGKVVFLYIYIYIYNFGLKSREGLRLQEWASNVRQLFRNPRE